jgi:hypothetical protein
MFQCVGGTRVRAAAAVWRACIGTWGDGEDEDEGAGVVGA